ncbi:MAG TPA: hypothetical protein VH723_00795 [Candidatus Limnocylindrales bacterium]|jgi:ElaB/YqjD/DUF883 family membrane-anchored ribosome-binding protein
MTMTTRTPTGRDAGRQSTMNGGDADRLKAAASGLAEQAGRTAEAQASTAMTKAGEALDQVAQAVRDAGSQMREQRPEIAGIADTAATRVEETARYLREHDARELMDQVQDFSRRQPLAVVGGSLVLGLLIGRFLGSGRSTTDSDGATVPRNRALTTPDYGTPTATAGRRGRTGAGTVGGL